MSERWQTMAERDACRRWLARAFEAAVSVTPRDFEAELVALHVAACEWAVRKDGTQPTMQEIETIDRHAAGHIDWFDKVTLLTANLVTYGTL